MTKIFKVFCLVSAGGFVEVDIAENPVLPEEDKKNRQGMSLDVQLADKVNFATAQNGISIIKILKIENLSTDPVTDIVLTMTARPGFLREKTWRIDRIAAGDNVVLHDLDVALDPVLLGGLDEAEWGQIHFTFQAAGLEVQTSDYPIEMLARDEWGGLSGMDNILAAFVSPNQPYIARILKEAGKLLEAAGHSGAIDGYQSDDPARVWMLAGAIWSAATALGLTYAVPPASFEKTGQKIRSPERIASEGLVTCLDSSLLLAACFEAAGLNTAILFSEGHAWAGVWLVKRDFGHLVEKDVVAVRKAVTAREFVAVETTLLTHRPSAGFEQATDAGRMRLSEIHEAEFVQLVDINRARSARIRPLASHQLADIAPETEVEITASALPRPLELGLLPGELADELPKTALGRIERWQRKLLDLSLTNRLLNFKDTKDTLSLLCPDLAGIEDRLADGSEFRLLALRDEQSAAGRSLTQAQLHQIEEGLARDALDRGQLAAPLTSRDMTNRLVELYRKARRDLAEGGTNTLFLAIGFLRWKRSEDASRSYHAPLLLVPIKLERRSAQSEFRLSQGEEEVRLNFTLLEMLKRDFELSLPELEGDLPRDHSGVDIPRIFEIIRHRIRDVAGFEVVEEAAISTFSFTKFLMWKDLVDRVDHLRQSPLVAHLIDNPETAFPGAMAKMPSPREIDDRLAPGDLLTPLPADSSQLAAVLAAAEERDFVLIGPPGTGKSQTITNIIADQLGRGRTVLFVAEKSAALDVVYRRLSQQGLANAVLELHSNKADRKKVLQQLDRSWARATMQNAQDWVRVSEELRLTRDQLNAYIRLLHRPGTQGFSIYQAVGRLVRGEAPFTLCFDNKDCHDEQRWKALYQLATEIGTHFQRISDLDLSGPISLLEKVEWSYGWQDKYLAVARKLEQVLQNVIQSRAELVRQLGTLPELVPSQELTAALRNLAEQRLGGEVLDQHLIANFREADLARPDLAKNLAEAESARKELKAEYPDQRLSDIPLETLDLQWREAQVRTWPLSALAMRKIRKLLQTYTSTGLANPQVDLPALKQLVKAQKAIAGSPLRTAACFHGEKTDIAVLEANLKSAAGYLQLEQDLIQAGLGTAGLYAARPELAQKDGGRFRKALADFQSFWTAFEAVRTDFIALGGISVEAHDGKVIEQLRQLPGLVSRFMDWLKWQETRHMAVSSGLAPLVEAVESGEVIAETGQEFEKAYMTWWVRLAMDAEPALRRFSQWQHEDMIRRFRELDSQQAGLAAGEVLRRLGNDLPHRDQVPRKSELGLLRHQVGLTRPSIAIRTLIAEMPTSFTRLAPCVLMSPRSIAQYLPAGQAQFDLVIFDEASQIPTWDAIGAIARGKRAIIVGDPRQMPPTNFFGRADDDNDEEDSFLALEKDMPSILDEVVVAGIPKHYLNWHYRSRDEALIAFSNHHYYEGNLVTFPSVNDASNAIQFHQVDGIYLRGKGRTNPDEAKAIVTYACGRLIDWLKLEEDKRPTLGVITFNSPQQTLIQDLFDQRLKDNPALEWFFSDDREEPLIVKNIENIQGDERDIMLFSITFGPDAAGKLPMNFGALNSDGGEKRLNVAVTRARCEMHVFTSVSADQIDLERTRARGVADLKAFLAYAKHGASALASQDNGSLGGVESPFEEGVMEALRIRGWDVRTQIGVSDYRIDLAVRHPDHAGIWLAGIECDGARYHSSATARDRDRVRQAVLEGLGWKILRIWSTEWFRTPEATLNAVDDALKTLLQEDRERREKVLS